ncbi:uncharacterized protein QC763_0083050 [Podospora pseudopauciseta]|uniref:Uncharacterized protein n=2 Tax=Podospora TaxID=5144 RepID=A0ABR0H8E7_9PEZI|nr:hypothetical protein QC763_0083050 [Podospora pseudopauciseta]KAK4675303.1 hypothetical protein QC764_0076600 [Podospora pseudoanserina]
MRDSLKFLCELPIYQEEQPYQLVGYADQEATPQGENCVFEAKEIDVQDAREHPVTLQTHGFAFFQFKSGCELAARHFETVGGDNSILTKYLDETVEFVRKMFKPVDIICFDWRLRRRDPTTGPGIPPRDLKDIRNYALPSGDVVHCDYSADGGFDRLKIQLLPDELAEYMKKGRKGMIVK